MHREQHWERWTIAGLLLLVVFLAGRSSVSLVGAAGQRGGIPDQKGLIHACYATNGGALRVINPSISKCRPTEAKLTWHQGAATTPDPYVRTVKTFPWPKGSSCIQGGPTYDANILGCVIDSLQTGNLPITFDLRCKDIHAYYAADKRPETWHSNPSSCESASVLDSRSQLTLEPYSLSLDWRNGKVELIVTAKQGPGPDFTVTGADTSVQYDAVYKP